MADLAPALEQWNRDARTRPVGARRIEFRVLRAINFGAGARLISSVAINGRQSEVSDCTRDHITTEDDLCIGVAPALKSEQT